MSLPRRDSVVAFVCIAALLCACLPAPWGPMLAVLVSLEPLAAPIVRAAPWPATAATPHLHFDAARSVAPRAPPLA